MHLKRFLNKTYEYSDNFLGESSNIMNISNEINPISKKDFIWLAIVFWSIIFTAFEAPFSFIFDTKIQTWQLYADGIFSVIFITDFILNIKSIRQNLKNERRNLDKAGKLSYYAIDLLACIPSDLIFYFLGMHYTSPLIKLIRLIRLVRIAKIVSMLNKFAIMPQYLKMKLMVVGTLVLIHWIACAWIVVNPMNEPDNITYYIKSMYWTITTLTTIGYGDIVPHTNGARLFTMIIMLSGVAFYGLVIGNIANMFAENARHKDKSREKLNDLIAFMKHYHVPARLQDSTINYYRHLDSKRLSENDAQIIAGLPNALKTELQTYMNMKLIRNVPVFKDCEQACLKEVAKALIQESYAPGEVIIQIGAEADEMYIIGHGSVEVILKDGNPVATLYEGQIFGEQALVSEGTRNANVRAQIYCDIYKLEKTDFWRIANKHPSLLEGIEKISGRSRRLSDRKVA